MHDPSNHPSTWTFPDLSNWTGGVPTAQDSGEAAVFDALGVRMARICMVNHSDMLQLGEKATETQKLVKQILALA